MREKGKKRERKGTWREERNNKGRKEVNKRKKRNKIKMK